MTPTPEPELVLLYDGVCAFCNRSVQEVLRHDRTGTMKFAPLQGEFAAGVLGRHPKLKGLDSLVLVERTGGGERVHYYSDAALRVARYLGGWFAPLALLGVAVPRPLRDLFYRLFARFRYRVFGKYEACMLPAAAVRKRFLDFN